jgi:hypothetical protein
VLSALVLWSWRPLVGWLLAVPITALFLWLDARLVRRWRESILAAWVCDALGLEQFRAAMSRIKYLPTSTLTGMFDHLVATVSGHSQAAAPGARAAVAEATNQDARREEQRLLAWVGVLTFATAVALVAVVLADIRISMVAGALFAVAILSRLRSDRISR